MTDSGDHHDTDGFTLLEMLVVIAIIAVATAIAMPAMMRPSDRLLLANAADDIRAALRMTRSASIAGNREQLFVIDAKERSYRSPAVKEARFSPAIEATVKVAEPEQLSSTRGGIRFFPDGSSTGGELTLVVGTRRAKLCVHWLTGQPETC
jgi:general secretion pathway protein H